MLFTKMKEMSWVKKGVAWTSKETDLSRGSQMKTLFGLTLKVRSLFWMRTSYLPLSSTHSVTSPHRPFMLSCERFSRCTIVPVGIRMFSTFRAFTLPSGNWHCMRSWPSLYPTVVTSISLNSSFDRLCVITLTIWHIFIGFMLTWSLPRLYAEMSTANRSPVNETMVP